MKKTVIMLAPDLDVRGGIPFVVQEYFKAGIAQKINLIFIPTHKNGGSLKKIGVFFKAIVRFIKFAPRCKESIVHLHTSQDGSFFRKFILFIIARLFGAKTIVHIHGSKFDIFMEKNEMYRWLTRYYFKKADCVLVMSSLWMKRLSGIVDGQKLFLVYNPISLSNKELNKNGSVGVLFLGRLGQRKGVYDLIEGVKKDREYFRRMKVRFILAGDGEVANVRRLVVENQLEDIVEVPGWISSGQKEAYLKSSDILILPSYNEQMPMSILEGMGYGYPVLASNVAGIPEMVNHGENGYLFNPGDIEAMNMSLRELCENKELREKMGKRSQELVKEKFESKKIVDELVAIYENL